MQPDLREHATTPERPTAAGCHGFQLLITGLRFCYQLCVRISARITVKHTVLVRQKDQQVGLYQVGNQCREGIIVAKTDLFRGNRIIFIDDRDDVELQQGSQGTACVQVTLPVRKVLVREQHLCRVQPEFLEAGFVGLYQTHLANRSSCLQFMQGVWTLLPAKARHALGNRSGRDQHQLVALLAQGSHLLPVPSLVNRELPILMTQRLQSLVFNCSDIFLHYVPSLVNRELPILMTQRLQSLVFNCSDIFLHYSDTVEAVQ